MENSPSNEKLAALIEQFKPYASSTEAYGRLYADLTDLAAASRWFLSIIEKNEGKTLSLPQIEDLLIDLDIQFIQHVTFHLNSLKEELPRLLANLPDDQNG